MNIIQLNHKIKMTTNENESCNNYLKEMLNNMENKCKQYEEENSNMKILIEN